MIFLSINSAQNSSNQPKKQTHVKTYLLATLTIVFIIFIAIPYLLTANPASCTRCHSMEPYYVSWQKSSHAKVTKNCFTCHVKEGTMNLLIYRISFYREIFASHSGTDLAPSGVGVPGTQSCQKKGCHSLNRFDSSNGDIKINHRNHIVKAHLTCVRCHPGAAHPNIGNVGDKTPPRKMCKQCHKSVMSNCAFCHKKRDLSPNFKH